MLHTRMYSVRRGGNVEWGWLGMQFVLEMRSCRGRKEELMIVCVCVFLTITVDTIHVYVTLLTCVTHP